MRRFPNADLAICGRARLPPSRKAPFTARREPRPPVSGKSMVFRRSIASGKTNSNHSIKPGRAFGESVEMATNPNIDVFTYGSNMFTDRIRARVASATPVIP